MSGILTKEEKQQRTANLLAAGNLWYKRKSSIALEQMSKISVQSLEPRCEPPSALREVLMAKP